MLQELPKERQSEPISVRSKRSSKGAVRSGSGGCSLGGVERRPAEWVGAVRGLDSAFFVVLGAASGLESEGWLGTQAVIPTAIVSKTRANRGVILGTPSILAHPFRREGTSCCHDTSLRVAFAGRAGHCVGS